MKAINKLIDKVLTKASKELSGEWILIGGALLPALKINYRSTVDIDLVQVDKTNDQNLELMKIAQEIGLPVESINIAASYFLYQIKDFKSNMILISQNKDFQLYRPNFYLYLKLKIARLSESDVLDIKKYYEYCKAHDSLETKKIHSILKEQNKSATKEKIGKIQELLDFIKQETRSQT